MAHLSRARPFGPLKIVWGLLFLIRLELSYTPVDLRKAFDLLGKADCAPLFIIWIASLRICTASSFSLRHFPSLTSGKPDCMSYLLHLLLLGSSRMPP